MRVHKCIDGANLVEYFYEIVVLNWLDFLLLRELLFSVGKNYIFVGPLNLINLKAK